MRLICEWPKADHGELRPAQNRLERRSHITLVQCSSYCAGEYQPALAPPASRLEALLTLTIAMALQHLHSDFRQGNGAAATFALGFNELQFSVDPLKRLTNVQLTSLKVKLAPP